MEETQFDVEHALSRNTTLPPIIPSLESEADEHEDVVADPAAAAAPTVPQTGVAQGLEEDPGTHQLPPLNNLADLALVLSRFQDTERRRILGSSTQEFANNRRQEIIPELNDEDYMHSELDEEYLQDEDEDEDEDGENKGDSIMELDPALPPPVNEASRESSPNLQMQGAEHGSHGEHRSERPCFTTRYSFINDHEVVAEVQYFDSDLPDQAAEPVNTEFNSVPAEHSLTSSNDALSMDLGPNSPMPVIEEGLVREIIKHVNPPSSGILTLATSMSPKTLLLGTSDTVFLCESTLEPATSSAGKGRIAEGVPVQKPAAYASVSGGERLMKPAV